MRAEFKVYKSGDFTVMSIVHLKDKTIKLQDIVNKDGYLYIDYMMAIDKKDEINFPREKFYRKNEIINYFDSNWEIISFRENHSPSFE